MKAGWLLLALGVMVGSAQAQTAQAQVTTFYSADVPSTPNAPFSADEVRETDRVLSDGNHIHHQEQSKRFRDSQGRTRTEVELRPAAEGNEAITHVHIIDPVKKIWISWDSQQRLAMVHSFANVDGKRVVPTPPACAPSASGCGGGGSSSVGSPGNSRARQSRTLFANSEQLGTQVIEGFTVTGTRFTRTTPVGVMGNEKPIVAVHETWVSPELHMALLSRVDDPMSGVTTTRLINIQRGEPDPQLFQPPADYTVKGDGFAVGEESTRP